MYSDGWILIPFIIITLTEMIDELFVSLGLERHEWAEDIKRGESSLASFLSCIEESISEREGRQFEEGLNSKVKLARFGKEVEFIRGICMGLGSELWEYD